ncbi:MAG: bacteriohemerythrin [Halobacteriovoraceae bacterium]|nr:bacteriohemerythrin [Halobacteriovoraceae bacterium]
MGLVTWTSEFATGIDTIDFQHKKLVGFLNDLHSAVESDGEQSLLVEITLGELIKYTQYHFSDEEEIMLKSGFSGLDEHKLKHDALKKQVVEFKVKYDNGEKIGNALIDFLKNWLINHIQKSDFEYVQDVKNWQEHTKD